MEILRFAPLIRVSSEKQKTKGESLNTQKAQLEEAIKSLNGSIYKMKRIRQVAKDRMTWDHKSYRFQYLLSRLIFDKESGHALTGCSTGGGEIKKAYYRTYDLPKPYVIPAKEIEKQVSEKVLDLLLDLKALSEAVFPDTQKTDLSKTLEDKKQRYTADLKRLENKLTNFARMIGDYKGDDLSKFFSNKLKPQIEEADREKNEIAFTLETVNNQLAILPNENELKERQRVVWDSLFERHKEHYIE